MDFSLIDFFSELLSYFHFSEITARTFFRSKNKFYSLSIQSSSFLLIGAFLFLFFSMTFRVSFPMVSLSGTTMDDPQYCVLFRSRKFVSLMDCGCVNVLK